MSIKSRYCCLICSIYVLLGHTLVHGVPIHCVELHLSDIVLLQLLPVRWIHLGLSQGFRKVIAGFLPQYQLARHGNTLIHLHSLFVI